MHLTTSEKERLELLHASTREGKKRDRIKALLLRSEGWKVPEIAQALRIHETSVTRHINDYRSGKLSPASGGSDSKLNESQTAELVSHLTSHTYHHTHEIIIYIKATYGIDYTVPGLNKWLHRHGFSYKKPKGRPHKANKLEQDAFIESYESLKKNLAEDESIVFMDSAHPSQNTKLSYGWIRKGQDAFIGTSASRTRVNLIGAITLNALSDTITADYDTINSEAIVDFFKRLREAKPTLSTLHIILDQAGYHRSDTVKKAAKKYNLKLHYLPPYSPNLNPIERLWKVMNEHARNNRFFKSSKDFKDAIKQFFDKTLPNIAESLNQRINDNFQKLQHAS